MTFAPGFTAVFICAETGLCANKENTHVIYSSLCVVNRIHHSSPNSFNNLFITHGRRVKCCLLRCSITNLMILETGSLLVNKVVWIHFYILLNNSILPHYCTYVGEPERIIIKCRSSLFFFYSLKWSVCAGVCVYWQTALVIKSLTYLL